MFIDTHAWPTLLCNVAVLSSATGGTALAAGANVVIKNTLKPAIEKLFPTILAQAVCTCTCVEFYALRRALLENLKVIV